MGVAAAGLLSRRRAAPGSLAPLFVLAEQLPLLPALQIIGESEVKAQIKLRFRTSTGVPVVVARSFQVRNFGLAPDRSCYFRLRTIVCWQITETMLVDRHPTGTIGDSTDQTIERNG